jgi:predicted enzyme related to lactoylglutathione lyase
MSVRLAYVNILAHDIDALADFYARVFSVAWRAPAESPV